MCNPFDCCSSQKYVVYITGSMENKKLFCEKVFDAKLKDISFSETLVRYNGANLILLVISNEKDVRDVHNMHMKMANAIIMLKEEDEKVQAEKSTLFVKMNGRTRLESENNLLVCSVVDGSFEEAKKATKQLARMIKSSL